MKCRFCGKKMKKDAVYCSKCGKKQTPETLPEGGYDDYEEYVDVTYTDYEEPVDYNEFDPDSGYTPPVRPKKAKSGKFPLIPVLVGIAAVAVILMLVLGNGSDGDEGRINNPTQGQTGHTQSKEEYPLYWPDFMLSLEEDTYTQELVTVLVTSKGEQNYGLQSYMGKVRVDQDHTDQIQEFVDMVQDECHFVLVAQENGRYYFRFQGSNAPVTMKSGDLEYHCIIATEQEDRGVMVTYQWMTDFSTNSSNAKMEPKQTAVKPMPEETKPIETKPVETKPVETKPVETKPVETTEPEPEFSESLLPYFLDEDRSGKFYLRYPEKLSDGDRVLFRADATNMEYIVEEYIDMMYDMGYKLVKKEQKDRSTWHTREWYLTCDKLSDSGKDWHVRIHIMVDVDDVYSTVTIDMIGGVKMDQVMPESGGGGSGWDDGDDDKYRPNCAMCGGDGKCNGCGGDGYKWSYGMDRERLNCSDCNASGKCWYCGGSGKR